ncbi:MAG: putative ABC transporter permease [Acutalibacteraceae bacterium]
MDDKKINDISDDEQINSEALPEKKPGETNEQEKKKSPEAGGILNYAKVTSRIIKYKTRKSIRSLQKNIYAPKKENKAEDISTGKSSDDVQTFDVNKPASDEGAKKRKKHKREKKECVDNKDSFAYGLNFYKLFWVFFIGCFIGVVVEVIFCLLVDHKYESRQGVIYGPFNPVYGFGAVLLTLALYWLRNKREIWVFLAGGVLGGAFEYACSWYQETFLGTVSWDYSNMIGNIGGRTSVFYMLLWGLLALLWLKYLFPFMSRQIERIPNKIGKTLTWLLVIFMAFDCIISSAAVNRMTARNEGIPARNAFDTFLDQTYPDEYLNEIYNHMTFTETGQPTNKVGYVDGTLSKGYNANVKEAPPEKNKTVS